MGLDYYSRRKYKHKKFLYLLDDEEKTAWIAKGHIGRCRRYRLPDHLMVGGECYTVESVELGAYNHPHTLQHLVIPDTFVYVDEDTLYDLPGLRSVHIGKRVEHLRSWNFRFCPKLQSVDIDKDNSHIKYENGMALSKDGKKLLAAFFERSHVTVPDGVEEINHIVFMDHQKLESVTFPKTLRKIGDNSFGNCPNLRSVTLPEGFEKFWIQSFLENTNLKHVDLPSTLTDLGYQTFDDCPNLQTVVLRSPKKLEFKDSFGAYVHGAYAHDTHIVASLFVPANLVEQYRQDPKWSLFKQILPINEQKL